MARSARSPGRAQSGVDPLVVSGLVELATGALTGWLYTLVKTDCEKARALGVKSGARVRQWHLDLIALGGLTGMASTAVPDLPRWVKWPLGIGAWPKTVVLSPGDRHLRFDRLAALPELFGPAVRGLPVAEHGFIPVDVHGKVRGVERVYAAGDATDFAVKHGGVAAQQADAAAEAIAALAGTPIEPKIFNPAIHGTLLTAEKPKYLTAHITGGRGFSSTISDPPTWSPPTKIAAKHLAPYLEQRDRSAEYRSDHAS